MDNREKQDRLEAVRKVLLPQVEELKALGCIHSEALKDIVDNLNYILGYEPGDYSF